MAASLSSFFVLAMTIQRGLSLEDEPGKLITWDDLTIRNSTSQNSTPVAVPGAEGEQAVALRAECTLNVVTTSYGAVAASQRDSPTEDTGFSFVKSQIIGSGMNYLGHAWGRYSRVVYAYCRIDSIVRPDGWSDWNDVSRRSTAYFGSTAVV
ncbi:putative pectinesterase 53 [Carex rostrata]